MNCDCYNEIAQQLLDKEIYEGREIKDVQMLELMYTFGNNGGKSGTLSYQEFEVELEGLKKPKKVKVSHTFCPYCGIAVGKLDETETDNNPLDKLK